MIWYGTTRILARCHAPASRAHRAGDAPPGLKFSFGHYGDSRAASRRTIGRVQRRLCAGLRRCAANAPLWYRLPVAYRLYTAFNIAVFKHAAVRAMCSATWRVPTLCNCSLLVTGRMLPPGERRSPSASARLCLRTSQQTTPGSAGTDAAGEKATALTGKSLSSGCTIRRCGRSGSHTSSCLTTLTHLAISYVGESA